MPDYLYKATTQDGKTKNGVITASDRNDAFSILQEQKLVVEEVRAIEVGLRLDNLFEKAKDFTNRVTLKDKLYLTRQLATIIRAGIPLIRALSIQETQTKNPKLKKIIQNIMSGLEAGRNFSETLTAYPDVFDNYYVNLIRAGEVSGSLDETLDRLAEQLEKTKSIQSKIRSALTLPLFTIIVMIGVMVLMMVMVIPQLADLFTSEGVELPMPTKVMIWLSNSLINHWYVYIIVIVVTITAFLMYIRSEDGKKQWDRFVLKPPVFGPLLQKMNVARFARNLATMMADGVPIIQAIGVVGDTITNYHYNKSVQNLIPLVEKGVSLQTATGRDPLFPSIMVQMLAIGEESGAIDAMMMKIAIFYEEEIDATIKNLTTLLEPFIIVLLAGGVGFIAVSILGPIYGLVEVI